MNIPKTVKEWNALAAQIRAEQPRQRMPVAKRKRSKLPVSPPVKSLPLHVVNRPKKGKFKIKSYFMTLLWKKRGTRVFEDFVCQCCDKSFSEGWRYVADESRVYLCGECKRYIKPQFTKTIYTPMA